ncbi:Hypothetical Protein OBI_RACECAR_252 [Arthrobacter phage Racecar]|nr:hypothetical protein PBI_RACECAR_44 [Arthrobacter phage Racecar]QFG12728.1 hypothetical protein PBI_MIMI_44 [Arthrobacter phage Mimi]
MKRHKVEVVWRNREARFDMVAPDDVDLITERVWRRFGKEGIVALSIESLPVHSSTTRKK